jgi:hypothetical protein
MNGFFLMTSVSAVKFPNQFLTTGRREHTEGLFYLGASCARRLYMLMISGRQSV